MLFMIHVITAPPFKISVIHSIIHTPHVFQLPAMVLLHLLCDWLSTDRTVREPVCGEGRRQRRLRSVERFRCVGSVYISAAKNKKRGEKQAFLMQVTLQDGESAQLLKTNGQARDDCLCGTLVGFLDI